MMGNDRNTEQGTMEQAEEPRREAESEAASAAAASATAEGAPGQSIEQRLAAAEAELARLKEDYLRALAETENVRRRAARDRQEAGQYAISSFARDLLSVADNLQRALGSVAEAARQQDPVLHALMNGVEMTEKELLTVLDRYGVRRIVAKGQTFDPHVHEALYEIPDPSVPHGTVLHEVQPGYTIHDRTLRPSRVGIARGGPKPGADLGDAGAQGPQSDEGVIPSPRGSGGNINREGDRDTDISGGDDDEPY